jgi:hypothetical protein
MLHLQDLALREGLKSSPLEAYLRSGSPHKQSDLLRAAASQARTIILLQPSSSSSSGGNGSTAAAEALKAASLMSLACLNPEHTPQVTTRQGKVLGQHLQNNGRAMGLGWCLGRLYIP